MSASRILKLTSQGQVRFYEVAASGQNYIALQAPAGVASNVTLTLPIDAGTAGYLLRTDGAGNLTWVPPGGGEEFANITILNQGSLRLRENSGNGTEQVQLRAPASLTATYTLTMPSGLPGSTQFLQCDNAGNLSFSAGAATLQSAYDAGEDLTIASGKTINIGQANNASALAIVKTGTGTGTAVTLEDDGTGGCLSLQQDGDAISLLVTKTAGSQPAIQVDGSGAISGAGLKINMPSAGTGRGIDITNSGGGIALIITQQTTTATAMQVNQSRNTFALDINKSGTGTGNVVDIDNDGTGVALNVNQDGVGIALNVSQNAATSMAVLTQTTNALGLRVFKSGSGAGTCLEVENDGTGVGLDIIQDGAGIALRVDQDGGAVAVSIDQSQDQQGVVITKSGAASAAAALKITHTAGPNETDPDIEGTSNNWSITRGGIFNCQRLAIKVAGATISSGGITINKAGMYEVDTEGAAATDDLDNIFATGGDAITAGTIVILRPINAGRTVVVRHAGGGSGNIRLDGAANYSMDADTDTLMLVYSGAVWLEVGRGNNGT
jgi:hypothetical protein